MDAATHEYRMRGWQRGFYLLLGLVISGIGIVGALALSKERDQTSLLFLILLPLVLGVYLLATALRSRLVIDGSRVAVRYAFTQKTADLSEIEGYRTVSTRNGSYWQLKLKEGRGTITVQKSFDCDGVRQWLQQIPDLDERDREALLDAIEQNQELGATPEERLAALRRARNWNIVLSAIAIAAAFAFALGSDQLHLPSAIVLALLPLALVYLLRRAPLLYAMFKPKRDPRTDLSLALMACGLGLIFGNDGIHFVEMPSLFEYAGLVGLLCCAAIFSPARQNPQFWGAMIGMLMIAGAYGWGLAATIDSLADHSPPAGYTAMVQGMHQTHGRSTSYYLDLPPWGPIQSPNHLSVGYGMYRRTSIGDQVCLEVHSGALRVQWYRMVACPEMQGQ